MENKLPEQDRKPIVTVAQQLFNILVTFCKMFSFVSGCGVKQTCHLTRQTSACVLHAEPSEYK